MKFKLMGIALATIASYNASATGVDVAKLLREVQQAQFRIEAQNLINWQVGDFHKLKVETVFGPGDGHKAATKEENNGEAIWLVSEMTILGQANKTEVLFNRADGKVLKEIVNGEEQDISQDGGQVEIIEQKETSVTVGAGTFDCLYVKAKVTNDGQATDVEAWVNPIDINLDGTLKITVQTMFGPISISLEQFGHQ